MEGFSVIVYFIIGLVTGCAATCLVIAFAMEWIMSTTDTDYERMD